MITISRQDDKFVFEVNGMHKLWAFKSQIIIPAEHILNAHQDAESIRGWTGWRLPGTYIPTIITAGTFYKDGKKLFWDASNMEKCIIVDLKDEDYTQLIIEVEDPSSAIALLTNVV
jgi:hypothetical protein